MMDTALHLQRSVVNDRYNRPSETFTPAQSYRCGFDPDPSTEGMNATEAAMMDARLRLPILLDEVIANTDRLRITHRFGVVVDSPVDFEIVGLPERGPSGLVFTLKRVTT